MTVTDGGLGEVAEGLQKQLAELRVDVRIATKRAELAELHAEIAKAAPTQGNELFYLDDAGNRRDAELLNHPDYGRWS